MKQSVEKKKTYADYSEFKRVYNYNDPNYVLAQFVYRNQLFSCMK